jgi:2-methylcitrate dehydratase PrpD
MGSPGAGQTSGFQQKLSQFVAETPFSALPADFVLRLKWSLLDSLGCGLYGSKTPWATKVGRLAQRQGKGPCRIWGAEQGGVSAQGAVLTNATMIQGFEIDDTHFGSRSHPGSITVPILLACAELGLPVTGQDALIAMAVGYELLARVGACQGISSFDRGWHPTGTAGVFGAAATAARLLKLDSKATTHALGIAGTMPAGLMSAQYGAMVKRLFAGHTSWVGLISAQLAEDGFTGIEDIFEVEYGGYPKAISDDIDMGALTDKLGEVYEGYLVGYKLFSCVGTNQTALQAVSELMTQNKFGWKDVEAIDVLTSEYQVLHSGWAYKPDSVLTAQMNMQYCIATLLIQGKLFVEQFSEDLLAQPDMLGLAARITATTDPAQDHKDRTAHVTIRLKDGRELRASCKAARGHTLNPPTTEEIEAKFSDLVAKILPEKKAQRIIEIVRNFERADNLLELSSLLAS